MVQFLKTTSAEVTGGNPVTGTLQSGSSPLAITAASGVEYSVARMGSFQSVTPNVSTRLMSTNLDSISNSGRNVPFLNRVRCADFSAIGGGDALSSGEGELDGYTDADGWIHSLPTGYTDARLLFAWDDFEPAFHQVPHEFKWTGMDGTVQIKNVDNLTQIGVNHWRGTPQMRNNWWINVTDLTGAGSDYPRDFQIYRTQDEALVTAGEMFEPAWVDLCTGMKELRFMDWQRTNSPAIDHVPRNSFHGFGKYPVSPEIIAAMANKVMADPWVNMHHLSTAAQWDEFASRLFAALDPALTVKVSNSNETWNFKFPQFSETTEAARTLWGGGPNDYWSDDYYGMQLVKIRAEFAKHFPDNRLKLVLEAHSNATARVENRLTSPQWLASGDPTYVEPSTVIDEIAITTYLGADLVKDEVHKAALIDAINTRTEESAFKWFTSYILGDETWASGSFDRMVAAIAAHKIIADALGVPLTLYEGGQHLLFDYSATMTDAERDIVNPFLIAFINSDYMAALYQMVSDYWLTISPNEPLMQFGLMSPENIFGLWGLLRNYAQPFVPRAELIVNGYAKGGAVVDYSAFLVPLTPRAMIADVSNVVELSDETALTYQGSPLTNAVVDGGTATGATIVGSALRNDTVDGFKGQSGETAQVASDQGYFIVTLNAAPAGDYVQTWLVTDGSATASTFNNAFATTKPEAAQVTLSLWASFQSKSNFARWFDVGDGLALGWHQATGRMSLEIKDTSGATVGEFDATTVEPLDVDAHHYVAVDLSGPTLIWKRNGVDVAYNTTTALSAGTGLVSKAGTLRLAGQGGTSMQYADVAIHYGSIVDASALYGGGTSPDPRTIGAPDYLVSYPIEADADAFADTDAGLNDGNHLGSANPFDIASGWTDA